VRRSGKSHQRRSWKSGIPRRCSAGRMRLWSRSILESLKPRPCRCDSVTHCDQAFGANFLRWVRPRTVPHLTHTRYVSHHRLTCKAMHARFCFIEVCCTSGLADESPAWPRQPGSCRAIVISVMLVVCVCLIAFFFCVPTYPASCTVMLRGRVRGGASLTITPDFATPR